MNSLSPISNKDYASEQTSLPPEIQRMHDVLAAQRIAYNQNPMPSAHERIERLARLRRTLVKYQDAFAEAISQDFSNRSVYETKIGEVFTCLEQCKYYSKNLTNWMKPSKRHIAALHQPAKAWVQYQPLGVVGIMAPWNYPLLLAVGPLICALAAGNHAMIKISSSSRNLGKVLEQALAEVFSEDLVSVINGGGAISDAFCRLKFDQMIFTGSPNIGKTVMAAASENLVPVILELGGKSPAIIHPSMPLKDAAERLAAGKLWNAGQTCVAPDYLFIPRGRTREFVAHMRHYVGTMYPSLRDNPDYTSIVNDKQYNRIQGYLQNARELGAEVFEINPANEDLSGGRKIVPTLLANLTDDMQVCQEEIFGPVLPIIEYDHIDEVLQYINARPHPLALYYFDYDSDRAEYVARRTHSGHFGINQVLTHVAQDDLPFGGVGNSGMGKYHGPEGFFSFSHARSVMAKPRIYSFRMILPPFGKPIHRIMFKTLLR
jgi:coniferyl-aldehyde dehydrogenase